MHTSSSIRDNTRTRSTASRAEDLETTRIFSHVPLQRAMESSGLGRPSWLGYCILQYREFDPSMSLASLKDAGRLPLCPAWHLALRLLL